MCASEVALLLLLAFALSKMFLFGSDGGISRPARTMTCWAIDFREDMPSGSLGMRPLAVDGAGEHEFAGRGEDLVLTEDCGEEDGGMGVVISASLLWFWLCWLCSMWVVWTGAGLLCCCEIDCCTFEVTLDVDDDDNNPFSLLWAVSINKLSNIL